ncbi:MAG: hypothetical protein ABL899_01550 [Nitrospira sp.]
MKKSIIDTGPQSATGAFTYIMTANAEAGQIDQGTTVSTIA